MSELQNQLAELLAKAQGGTGSDWGAAPTGATAAPTGAPSGLSIPIKIRQGGSSLRVYLQFGPEHAATPETIMALVNALSAQGYPLDIWRPRQPGWSGGGGGGGGGGFRQGGW